MSDSYIPLVTPPEKVTEPALWFAFRKAEILVVNGAEQPALPCCMDIGEHGLAPQRNQYLGLYGRQALLRVEITNRATACGWAALGLRVCSACGDDAGALSGGRISSSNGTVTISTAAAAGRRPRCARTSARALPCLPVHDLSAGFACIMILITTAQTVAGAQGGFPKGRYSALAGFVEPGDAEDTVSARRARSRVEVKTSATSAAPWPFPHSLMVAFTAEYAGVDITPDWVEIGKARWFELDNCQVAGSISISRRLIDTVAGRLAGASRPTARLRNLIDDNRIYNPRTQHRIDRIYRINRLDQEQNRRPLR